MEQYVESPGYDDKCSAFEDGGDDEVRVKNNILDFSNGTTDRVTKTRDGDDKGNIFEDGNDDGAGVENKYIRFQQWSSRWSH